MRQVAKVETIIASEGGDPNCAMISHSLLCACPEQPCIFNSLLHDGRNPDWPLCVFQLDAAHGQHHYFSTLVGFGFRKEMCGTPAMRFLVLGVTFCLSVTYRGLRKHARHHDVIHYGKCSVTISDSRRRIRCSMICGARLRNARWPTRYLV